MQRCRIPTGDALTRSPVLNPPPDLSTLLVMHSMSKSKISDGLRGRVMWVRTPIVNSHSAVRSINSSRWEADSRTLAPVLVCSSHSNAHSQPINRIANDNKRACGTLWENQLAAREVGIFSRTKLCRVKISCALRTRLLARSMVDGAQRVHTTTNSNRRTRTSTHLSTFAARNNNEGQQQQPRRHKRRHSSARPLT